MTGSHFQNVTTPRLQPRYVLLLLLFLVSGGLGLGYQVLWSKYVLSFLGVSAYSYATVLAAFMAGLALGAWLFGKTADRVASPLKLYAYLDLGVGVYAILYKPLTGLGTELYGALLSSAGEDWGPTYGIWAKIIVAGLLLLPPTILMGGTLPAMVRYATESIGLVGKRVSQFYAINAAGAALGSLLMAFYLLPALGKTSSLMLLAVGNAVVAVAALLMAKKAVSKDSKANGGVETNLRQVAPSRSQIRLVLALACAAGFFSFVYEIAWTRFFSIVVGSSTYSFAIMLAAFISGIAIGSLLLSRFDQKIRSPLLFFGWTQLVAPLTVVIFLPWYPQLSSVVLQFRTLLSNEPDAFYLFSTGKFLLCFVIMLPPTVLLGMSIPLLIMGLSRELSALGRETGRVYAWNTLGNVAGASLGGLWLLSLFGMESLLSFAAFGNIVVGALAVSLLDPAITKPTRVRRLATASVVVAIVCSILATTHWDPRWFTLQTFRPLVPGAAASLEQAIKTREIWLFLDDPAGNLMVSYIPHLDDIALWVNGKVDASSTGDMPTQVFCAHIPILLNPNPKDVLIVGLASGITAGAALTHPIDRVDVVELLRRMPEATAFFEQWNRKPADDPRYHLIFDDARSYLVHTQRTYDVIISEPSNPWMAGTASLFTTETFENARKKLNPGGIYLQWIQAYEISDEAVCSIISTFNGVFPYIYGFQGQGTDLLLLGSMQPIRPDWAEVERRVAIPAVRNHLSEFGASDVADMLMLQRFSPATARILARLGPAINTDDNLWLEHRAPRDLFRGLSPEAVKAADERIDMAPSLLWHDYRHAMGGTTSLRESYTILSLDRYRTPRLGETLDIVSFQTSIVDPPFSVPPTEPLPLRWTEHTPLPVDEVVATIDNLLARQQNASAARVLTSYESGIIHESFLSEDAYSYWLNHVRRWEDSTRHLPSGQSFRALAAHLLAAHRQTGSAAPRYRALFEEPNPPEWVWALIHACALGDQVCSMATEIYSRRGLIPEVHQTGLFDDLGGSSEK
jgi:predicted membrane-bound spermidine synthase